MSERDELVAKLRDHALRGDSPTADAADQIERDGREIERMRKSLIIANDFLNKCDYQPGRDFAGIMVRAALNSEGET